MLYRCISRTDSFVLPTSRPGGGGGTPALCSLCNQKNSSEGHLHHAARVETVTRSPGAEGLNCLLPCMSFDLLPHSCPALY